jgi:SAM-dependent methyltransferase
VTAAAEQPALRAPATAEEVAAAWDDPKLANVLYHDWEAGTYDEKWSISFDERCIDYARDRFAHVAGAAGWPYGRSLELGCGTGFFTLNIKLAGVIDEGHVTDLSPGMVEVAQAALRRREVRHRHRARRPAPHPRPRPFVRRDPARPQARRAVRLRR